MTETKVAQNADSAMKVLVDTKHYSNDGNSNALLI